MKVSKKRLIEIVTEEISRMRKEAWGDDPSHHRQRTTYAGQSHDEFMGRGAHDEAPRRGRSRRRKPAAPRPEPSPEEKHAQQLQFAKDAGFGDGFSYGGSKHRHHYEHDPDLVAAYDERNAVGLEKYRAFNKARGKPVAEGTWDDRPTRRKSRSRQMADANDHAEEDAEFIQTWDHDYDDRDLPHNHHGKYGWGPDEPGIGEAGKYYWKRRQEVLQHFKDSGDPVWYTNE